jgi:16S rRNA processing protein RimM
MRDLSSNYNSDDWLEIGTIVAPQGLKGELRVIPDSDFPERFEEPGKRWIKSPQDKQPQPIELTKGYQIPGKNLYVVKLAGVEDRDRAEELRGCKLLVSKSDRLELEEGEYHVYDLINLEVYHQLTGENVGVVVDIYWAGNDLLEVKLHQKFLEKQNSKKAFQNVFIPFVNEIVPVVDIKAGRLEINPPLGLLEINQN